jgi:CRP-like cAMP-binding protein
MLPNKEIQAIVSKCFLLRKLNNASGLAVIEAGHIRHFFQGSYIFHQGEEAEWLYILISGQVKLAQLTQEGDQVVMNYFGPGQGLGIIVALNDDIYPVSAEVVKDCQLIGWHRDEMKTLMEHHAQLALNGMKMMGDRFTRLQARLLDVSTKRVEQRVARAIMRLVRQFGKRQEDGVLIDVPLTRQDIAEMTGTNVYSVSRIISKWEQAGWVVSRRKQITLTKPHKLVVLAEDLNGSSGS